MEWQGWQGGLGGVGVGGGGGCGGADGCDSSSVVVLDFSLVLLFHRMVMGQRSSPIWQQ